jgi:hypothetical protein
MQLKMHCDSATPVVDTAGGHTEYRFSAPKPDDTTSPAYWGAVTLEIRARFGSTYTVDSWYTFDFPGTPTP